MRIAVLGPLEVRNDAGVSVPVGGTRLRQLLIRLAIGDGRAVSVERLAGDLWPDGGPADAPNAIQALVSRLRAVAGRDCIEHGPAGYRLAADPAQVDAREFERLVADAGPVLAGGDSATGAAMLRQALGLWRGPALADVADCPFAAAPIARLSELRLTATEDRIDAELTLGRGAELVAELQELAAAHPLRERLRGQLMRALQAAGRQADALTAFEQTRRLLADELGVDPSPGLAAVHLAILRGEPLVTAPLAGPASAAGGDAPSPARRWGNLPAQLTSFVGREAELRQVSKLLTQARLVTLTGPGGAGKTRLSIEAAARLTENLTDGVCFVPLAPVRDALDVPQAVLAAVGGTEPGWLDPAEAARQAALQPLDRLSELLAARQLLLVLDNCEHLVSAVAWLAGRVLADAPRVRILATSREPLGITGETLCPVPSLALPAHDAGVLEAASSPAVRLFADRAAAVRPGFDLDETVVGPVVRICRALDGIPLAIELAAARLRALTAAQVADRLDDRFRLLSVGSRAALPRHQTLRAIVDWSWELLDDAERTVLRRLSVFSGGATPGSAEQVCSLRDDHRDVVDIVAALVDKSLVTATGEQDVRYRLLETVRAYAADRLAEAGEQDQVKGAHAAYFLALAERAEPELRARDQLLWLDLLSAEHDNCAAALRYVIEARDVASAVRFVGALAWFWITRDYDKEAGEWAASVRELSGDAALPGLRDAHAICELMVAMSRAQSQFPTMDQMREAADRALAMTAGSSHPLLVLAGPMSAVLSGDVDGAQRGLTALAEHADPWLRAAQALFRGHLAIHAGNLAEGQAQLRAAYAGFTEIGDRWALLICLSGMADIALARDEPDAAVRMLEEAHDYAVGGLANNFGEMMRVPLGKARARAGDIAGARADLQRAVGVAGRIGEHDDEASGYVELSEIARRESDLPLARGLLEKALGVVTPKAERPDMRGVAAIVYSRLGCLAEQEGDLAAAAPWHARAIGMLANAQLIMMPSNPVLATVVEGIAALTAARDQPARAMELAGLADVLRGFTDSASLELGRVRLASAAALSDADAAAAYGRGRELSRDDALALVP